MHYCRTNSKELIKDFQCSQIGNWRQIITINYDWFWKGVNKCTLNRFSRSKNSRLFFFISAFQAVFRKVQYFGLQNAYQNGGIWETLFQIDCLSRFCTRKRCRIGIWRVSACNGLFWGYFYWTSSNIKKTSTKTIWNVKQRLDSGLPKTNNHVEGWHRRIQSSVG